MPFSARLWLHVNSTTWTPDRPIEQNDRVWIIGGPVGDFAAIEDNGYTLTSTPNIDPQGAGQMYQNPVRGAVQWHFRPQTPGTYTINFSATERGTTATSSDSMTITVVPLPPFSVELTVRVNGQTWNGGPIPAGADVVVRGQEVNRDEVINTFRFVESDASAPTPLTGSAYRIDSETVAYRFSPRLGYRRVRLYVTDYDNRSAEAVVGFDVRDPTDPIFAPAPAPVPAPTPAPAPAPTPLALNGTPLAAWTDANQPVDDDDMAVRDISGNWYDRNGARVEILQIRNRIRLAQGGWIMQGTYENRSLRVTRRYASFDETPARYPAAVRQRFVGTSMIYAGVVSEDGLKIDGRIDPSDADTMQNTLDWDLTRQPFVTGVHVITESWNDLLRAEDLRRPWFDASAARAVNPRREHQHLLLVYGRFLPRQREITLPDNSIFHGEFPSGSIAGSDPLVPHEGIRSWKVQDVFWRPMPFADEVELAIRLAFDRAWTDLAADLGTAQVAQIKAMESILVEAWPIRGALPGTQTIRLGPVEVAWELRRPRTAARLEFVRVLDSGDSEALHTIILNCVVYVEIRVEAEIARNSLEVAFGVNGNPLVWGPTRRETVTAHRDATDRTVYRTPPMIFFPPNQRPSRVPAGTRFVSVADNGKVHAGLAGAPLVDMPPSVTVRARLAPRDVGAEWLQALQKAADVHTLQVPDLASATAMEVDTVYTVVVTFLEVLSVNITLGVHASAILLRDQLVGMLDGYIAFIEQRVLGDPVGLRGFLEAVRPQFDSDTYPLGLIEIAGPTGTVTLRDAVKDEYLRRNFPSRAAAEAYMLTATGDALRAFLDKVREARRKAFDTDDDEIKNLLRLTGFGFEPVVRRLRPYLMRQYTFSSAAGDYLWVRNDDARRWLGWVRQRAEELRANGELGAADTNVLIAIASLGILAAPASMARAVFAALLSVFDVVDAALSWYNESEERDFALGAAAVIGEDRFREAELQSLPLWAHVLSLVAAGIGLAGDALEVLSTASVALARTRAGRLAARFEADGLNGLRQMDNADRRDFLVAVFDAQRASRQGEALTPLQQRMLRIADRLEDELQRAGLARRLEDALNNTPQDLRDALPASLRDKVPIVRESGPPGSRSVFVDYELGPDGLISHIRLRVGPVAEFADVQFHANTVSVMHEYTSAVTQSRGLVDRFRTWARRYGQPPVGTMAWEAMLEVEKLSAIIIDQRMARIAEGNLTLDQVNAARRDIQDLGAQLTQHNRTLQALDNNPGRGFVAAQSFDDITVPDPAWNPLARAQYRSNLDATGSLDRIIGEYRNVKAMLDAAHASANPNALYEAVEEQVYQMMLRSSVITAPPGSLAAQGEALQRTTRALLDVQQRVPAGMYRTILRTPGSADLIADLARAGTLETGATYHLRMLVDELQNGRTLAIIEDRMPSLPRFDYAGAAANPPGRVVRSAADLVNGDGRVLQAKSFSEWDGPWGTPISAVVDQVIKDMVRYADQTGKCSADRQLNGIFEYRIDAGTLGAALTPARRLEAAATSGALTSWAGPLFGGHYPRELQIIIRFW